MGLLFEADPILTCRVCGKRGPSTLYAVTSAALDSTPGASATTRAIYNTSVTTGEMLVMFHEVG